MKTKHSVGTDGKPLFIGSSRGRGRPKRNDGKWTRISPESDEYFKTIEKGGGPTNPISYLKEIIEELIWCNGDLLNPEHYPLFKTVSKYRHEITPYDSESEHPISTNNLNDSGIDYKKLTDEQKYYLSCDEVFAYYLNLVAQKVNHNFYKTVLRFIISFREWLNKYGWKKKEIENNGNLSTGLSLSLISEHCEQHKSDDESNNSKLQYWEVNNAEHAPDVWNELITIYLVENDNGLSRGDAIDLTVNFWHWLYINGHTWSKLSKISN